MSMVNRRYLLRGIPVVVLTKWRHVPTPPGGKAPPRNVLIQLPDETKVVRPFRGLKKL